MSSESTGVGLDATLRDFASGQKVFNRYTLMRVLGRGGMGIVWLAHDEVLDRDVALKFLPEIIIHDRAVLEDLKRETKRSLELTHKNIIRIHDFVHDVISGCISMEYIEGDTLSNLRADKPAKIFEPDELKPWLKQLCEALDYAHNHARIIHRDLKPSNLMISQRGQVKVADFGIARSLSDSVSMLTQARGTSGTLVYMSPQQLDGGRGTHLDDIYSLGATIYELLTSKPPFYSGNIDRQIREKIAPSMMRRRKDLEIEGNPIPSNWEETVAACLAKDPGRRPQSVAEIAQRLQLTSPPRPPKLSKKKHVAALTAAGAAATILATIFVSAMLRQHEPLAKQRKQTQQMPPAATPTSKLEQTKKAAAQGDAEAQTNLAISYQNGIGVPKDLAKAAELYNHAADQGNAVAQNNLGRMYDKGIGVGKDLKKAVVLYEKAADQGNADAQNNLAFLYASGVGVARDLSKAMGLYQKAADQGNAYARQQFETLPKYTEESADRFARMFGKAGNQGELYAQLGVLYENGTGVPRDLKKAAELYQKAADDGNSIAQNNLANLYEQGKGVPRDYDKAVQLFQKAADQNYPSAQASLGRLYFYGEGVPQNLTKAVELFQKAADKGDSDAQCWLGRLYANGTGLPKDLNKAAELYRKAADQGSDEAREHLRGLEQAASINRIPQQSTLRIADVKASETPDPNVDTNLTLRISVTKLPNAVINHTNVKIQVYFYDTVGDNEIKLTNADVSYEWLTPNHDWNSANAETLAVTYVGPNNKGAYGEPGQPDHRKYLGYIVRVYYNDQLQDKRGEPSKLLTLFPPPTTAPPQ